MSNEPFEFRESWDDDLDADAAAAEESVTEAPRPFLARQGDVLLQQVDRVPHGWIAIDRNGQSIVLAHGEVTGHAHRIEDRGARLLVQGEDRYLHATAPVSLVHEEHAAIRVPPGSYRVVIQREYVPADVEAARVRRVVD